LIRRKQFETVRNFDQAPSIPVFGKQTNWHLTRQQISFAVISTGGSTCAVAVTYEDPTGAYPLPVSSAPTSSPCSRIVQPIRHARGEHGPDYGLPVRAEFAVVGRSQGQFIALQAGIR
jgi:hypothetical protein